MTKPDTHIAPIGASAPVDQGALLEEPARPQISKPTEMSHVDRLNFRRLIIHHIAIRTGWIFKTESVVIPAVLDLIGGSAWLRGWLPTMSRLGQSIPPLFVANTIRCAPLKKRILAVTSMLMGFSMLGISLLWLFSGGVGQWLALSFLFLYTFFFACTGTNQVVLGTLQSKLVYVNRRGRLMLFANVMSTIVSLSVAWLLLRHWFSPESINVVAIFFASGLFFLVGGTVAHLLIEPADSNGTTSGNRGNLMRQAWTTVRKNRQFRLLAIVTSLFGMTLTLFPHYQALALQRLNLDLTYLIPWLIAQNIGVGVFSVPVGSLADRLGNLWALRILMLLAASIPLLALLVASLGPQGQNWFTLVYLLLGLTPITMRITNNYALELAVPEEQPIHLSTLGIFLAAGPIVAGPLIGILIDVFGFELAFGSVAVLLLLGFGLTLFMLEPRSLDIEASA